MRLVRGADAGDQFNFALQLIDVDRIHTTCTGIEPSMGIAVTMGMKVTLGGVRLRSIFSRRTRTMARVHADGACACRLRM